MDEHIAGRPSWLCLSCGDTWPCDPSKNTNLSEMDSMQLAINAWVNLEEAAGDLPGMSVATAFERFISWTRPGLPNPYEGPEEVTE